METITVKPKKTPTPKQLLAAKRVIENLQKDKPEDLGKILADIGYSKGITETPSIVTNSEGFKKALNDLGLTEELIASSLVFDIQNKPKARVKELGLGAEILGMKKREPDPTPSLHNTTYNFIFSDGLQEKVKLINEEIKSRLINA